MCITISTELVLVSAKKVKFLYFSAEVVAWLLSPKGGGGETFFALGIIRKSFW